LYFQSAHKIEEHTKAGQHNRVDNWKNDISNLVLDTIKHLDTDGDGALTRVEVYPKKQPKTEF